MVGRSSTPGSVLLAPDEAAPETLVEDGDDPDAPDDAAGTDVEAAAPLVTGAVVEAGMVDVVGIAGPALVDEPSVVDAPPDWAVAARGVSDAATQSQNHVR